ncbi:unnamed protein product [Lactuca saligna]|uniref:DUF4371 domain-containing protein n=1 Tax=Lactuca saligna TaxID=75948 RepID=A0AA36ECB6_LACSI|nr:unnamed protein product [Lactuca saligna]
MKQDKIGSFFGRTSINKSSVGESSKRTCSNDLCLKDPLKDHVLLINHFLQFLIDVSKKEQMTIVLRYVDNLEVVKERFIGVVHMKYTSSLTLKAVIDEVKGQGYNGARNMRGAFNGLKALINDLVHFVHCFAHQLQLDIVGVAKKHDGVEDIFEKLSLVVNVDNSDNEVFKRHGAGLLNFIEGC